MIPGDRERESDRGKGSEIVLRRERYMGTSRGWREGEGEMMRERGGEGKGKREREKGEGEQKRRGRGGGVREGGRDKYGGR